MNVVKSDKLFKRLEEMEVHKTPVSLDVPPEEIQAWQDARSGTAAEIRGKTTIQLNCGWGKLNGPVPCHILSAARYEDHWEILNQDGKTHRLGLDEVMETKEVA
jgi:hypothetical protein